MEQKRALGTYRAVEPLLGWVKELQLIFRGRANTALGLGTGERTGPVAWGRSCVLGSAVHVATSIGPPRELSTSIGLSASIMAVFQSWFNGTALARHVGGSVVLILGTSSFPRVSKVLVMKVESSKADLEYGRNGAIGHILFEFNRNGIGQGSSFGHTPISNHTVFTSADVHELPLNLVHAVVHEVDNTNCLAIVTLSIAGDNVRISPQPAGCSMACSELLVETVRLEVSSRFFWQGFQLGALDEECREAEEKEANVELDHGIDIDIDIDNDIGKDCS